MKPCKFPMCPNLCEGRYCEQHKALEKSSWKECKRDTKVMNARYGREWKRIRAMFIDGHPFCEICLKDNKFTHTEEVHHILPLSKGGTHSFGNLQALCKSCHSRITMSTNHKDGAYGGKGEKNL